MYPSKFSQLSKTSATHAHYGKETSIMVFKLKNSFSEKKLPFIEKLRIKSTTCFKDQISIMLWYFSDATINKIILKSPTRGEWFNEIWRCKWIGKFPVQTSLGAWEPKLPSRFSVTFGSKLWINPVINIEWVRLPPW